VNGTLVSGHEDVVKKVKCKYAISCSLFLNLERVLRNCQILDGWAPTGIGKGAFSQPWKS